MPPLESPQLRFLSEAASLLGRSSPSTAAYLMTAHTHILHDESKPVNPRQTKSYCTGCGSLRICKASKVLEVKPQKTSQKNSRSSIGGRATVYKCVRCNKRAIIPRKRPAPRLPPKTSSRSSIIPAQPSAEASSTSSTPVNSTQQDHPATTSSTTAPPEKTADNISSKKRAKARKQGGLQALLASKKSSQPSLDLFDFLQ